MYGNLLGGEVKGNAVFEADLKNWIDHLGVNPTDKVLLVLQDAAEDGMQIDAFTLLDAIDNFNNEGPYAMGKRLGVDSEDMAVEFMSFINKVHGTVY